MAESNPNNDLFQAFIDAGLMTEGEYSSAEDLARQVRQVVDERGQLASRVEEFSKTQSSPKKGQAAASQGQAESPPDSSTDPVLATADRLQAAGIIQKKDGKWASSDPSFAPHANALNTRDERLGQVQTRAMQMLAEKPDAFIAEFLGEPLKKLLAEQIGEALKPVNQQMEKFVRQPTDFDKFVEKHGAELDDDKSPLRKAYNRLFHEAASKLESQGVKDRLDEETFSNLVHGMIADQAVSESESTASESAGKKVSTGAQAGESPVAGEPPAKEQQKQPEQPDTRSALERAANGETLTEGARNNGNTGGSTLNEHASQTGDYSVPTRSNGKADFMAVAAGVAADRGYNF